MPPSNAIMGGTPESNKLAEEITYLCKESTCTGFEMIGAIESVKHVLIAGAYAMAVYDAKETDRILREDIP